MLLGKPKVCAWKSPRTRQGNKLFILICTALSEAAVEIKNSECCGYFWVTASATVTMTI
jgi:hypothetical protein